MTVLSRESARRVREAAVGTDWAVEEVQYDSDEEVHYRVALAKR